MFVHTFPFYVLSVDGLSSSSVVVGEVTTLAHEARNDTVEARTLVSESRLASTELSEVLGRLGDNISPELHNDAASRLTADRDIKENLRVGPGAIKRRRKRVRECEVPIDIAPLCCTTSGGGETERHKPIPFTINLIYRGNACCKNLIRTFFKILFCCELPQLSVRAVSFPFDLFYHDVIIVFPLEMFQRTYLTRGGQ